QQANELRSRSRSCGNATDFDISILVTKTRHIHVSGNDFREILEQRHHTFLGGFIYNLQALNESVRLTLLGLHLVHTRVQLHFSLRNDVQHTMLLHHNTDRPYNYEDENHPDQRESQRRKTLFSPGALLWREEIDSNGIFPDGLKRSA